MPDTHDHQEQDDLEHYRCFVSMPFAEDFREVFFEGIQGARRIFNHAYGKKRVLDLTRLDIVAYDHRVIEQNVFRNIRLSHLLIADISRYAEAKDPNVSVMHEIGYACGQNIPVVLIGRKDTFKALPANLKGSIVLEYDTERDPRFESFSHELSNQLNKTIEADLKAKPRGIARAEVFTGRDDINLPELVANARERIWILTTNLDFTANHLSDKIVQALHRNKTRAGFEVVILTMDPESNVANARAIQLGRSPREYRDELRHSLNVIAAKLKDNRATMMTYDILPTQMTFIIDNMIVTSVVSLGRRSRGGIHFLVESHGPGDVFLRHFEVVRMHSRHLESSQPALGNHHQA